MGNLQPSRSRWDGRWPENQTLEIRIPWPRGEREESSRAYLALNLISYHPEEVKLFSFSLYN